MNEDSNINDGYKQTVIVEEIGPGNGQVVCRSVPQICNGRSYPAKITSRTGMHPSESQAQVASLSPHGNGRRER
jgi:hypothetical protein